MYSKDPDPEHLNDSFYYTFDVIFGMITFFYVLLMSLAWPVLVFDEIFFKDVNWRGNDYPKRIQKPLKTAEINDHS